MSAKFKIIDSYQTFDYEVIKLNEATDADKSDGKIMMKGILQKADVLNQNGRVYPLHVLEREVRNYQKFILENRAMGELDHPPESVVSLKNVSHIVREAYIEKGVVYGSIEVLHKTPSGAILKGLVESGVKIGISSRGVGSTKKQGDYQVVADDFQLICWDVVSEPSTSGAFMIPEGKEFNILDLKRIFTKSDRIDRLLNEIIK
jgi:hypothetical protein